MTKTLTEQWREGTLPLGTYYIVNKNGDEEIDRSVAVGELWNNTDLKEVLAPVPSYDHFSQLVKKVEHLQEQLADANKTIDYYDKKDFHYTLDDGTVMGAEPAHKYKTKWGAK